MSHSSTVMASSQRRGKQRPAGVRHEQYGLRQPHGRINTSRDQGAGAQRRAASRERNRHLLEEFKELTHELRDQIERKQHPTFYPRTQQPGPAASSHGPAPGGQILYTADGRPMILLPLENSASLNATTRPANPADHSSTWFDPQPQAQPSHAPSSVNQTGSTSARQAGASAGITGTAGHASPQTGQPGSTSAPTPISTPAPSRATVPSHLQRVSVAPAAGMSPGTPDASDVLDNSMAQSQTHILETQHEAEAVLADLQRHALAPLDPSLSIEMKTLRRMQLVEQTHATQELEQELTDLMELAMKHVAEEELLEAAQREGRGQEVFEELVSRRDPSMMTLALEASQLEASLVASHDPQRRGLQAPHHPGTAPSTARAPPTTAEAYNQQGARGTRLSSNLDTLSVRDGDAIFMDPNSEALQRAWATPQAPTPAKHRGGRPLSIASSAGATSRPVSSVWGDESLNQYGRGSTSQGRTDQYEVILARNAQRANTLGITIRKEPHALPQISRVRDHVIYIGQQRLELGDILLAVDGRPVDPNGGHDEAVEMLKASGPTVRLLVRPMEGPPAVGTGNSRLTSIREAPSPAESPTRSSRTATLGDAAPAEQFHPSAMPRSPSSHSAPPPRSPGSRQVPPQPHPAPRTLPVSSVAHTEPTLRVPLTPDHALHSAQNDVFSSGPSTPRNVVTKSENEAGATSHKDMIPPNLQTSTPLAQAVSTMEQTHPHMSGDMDELPEESDFDISAGSSAPPDSQEPAAPTVATGRASGARLLDPPLDTASDDQASVASSDLFGSEASEQTAAPAPRQPTTTAATQSAMVNVASSAPSRTHVQPVTAPRRIIAGPTASDEDQHLDAEQPSEASMGQPAPVPQSRAGNHHNNAEANEGGAVDDEEEEEDSLDLNMPQPQPVRAQTVTQSPGAQEQVLASTPKQREAAPPPTRASWDHGGSNDSLSSLISSEADSLDMGQVPPPHTDAKHEPNRPDSATQPRAQGRASSTAVAAQVREQAEPTAASGRLASLLDDVDVVEQINDRSAMEHVPSTTAPMRDGAAPPSGPLRQRLAALTSALRDTGFGRLYTEIDLGFDVESPELHRAAVGLLEQIDRGESINKPVGPTGSAMPGDGHLQALLLALLRVMEQQQPPLITESFVRHQCGPVPCYEERALTDSLSPEQTNFFHDCLDCLCALTTAGAGYDLHPNAGHEPRADTDSHPAVINKSKGRSKSTPAASGVSQGESTRKGGFFRRLSARSSRRKTQASKSTAASSTTAGDVGDKPTLATAARVVAALATPHLLPIPVTINVDSLHQAEHYRLRAERLRVQHDLQRLLYAVLNEEDSDQELGVGTSGQELTAVEAQQALENLIFVGEPHLLLRAILTTWPMGAADFSEALVVLAIARGGAALGPLVQHAVRVELQETKGSNEVFRGNSIRVRCLRMLLRTTCRGYLLDILQEPLQRILGDAKLYQQDARRKGKAERQHQVAVATVVQDILNRLYQELNAVPLALRHVLAVVRSESVLQSTTLEWSVLRTMFFLRFLCPALSNPVEYGLLEGEVGSDGAAALVLVSQVLQAVGNGSGPVRGSVSSTFQELILSNQEKVERFLQAASLSIPGAIVDVEASLVPIQAQLSTYCDSARGIVVQQLVDQEAMLSAALKEEVSVPVKDPHLGYRVMLRFLHRCVLEGAQNDVLANMDPDSLPIPTNHIKRANSTTPTASCFEAFYVQWLESSGLQVAIIPYSASDELLETIMGSVNGVLFTGGELGLQMNSTYYQTANKILQQVKAKNDAGTHFPLWGTCMGFQLLHILVANNESALSRNAFDSEDISLPLIFTQEASTSRLFGGLPANMQHNLATENLTSNLHHDGVAPTAYSDYPELAAFYSVLSTNTDRQGKAFVSSVESKNYPIFAVQWHPERPQFEWVEDRHINHSLDAIEAMQYVGRFLSSQVRQKYVLHSALLVHKARGMA
ncbi:uncharacterized protein MONBRDRAFT_28072 [Monosiga brevicollis MX1]|uniref:folate gamma-glutamyl hydrolase n=1 Tax=Monosiga brevicollis TaxID=81824 RepID=A9V742_MONBE|nr:uncharacterized protein MONBRDRAFT_28072 [Monosiga brevicollis MX1]EDQ86726.1 predicted protein [Monosiga brevicollis MX1]|eukprot:XP_001748562.1 hypothetical protein [Monosiga brevicollis MX1]